MFENYFTENWEVYRNQRIIWTDRYESITTWNIYKWKIVQEYTFDKETRERILLNEYTFSILSNDTNIDILEWDVLKINWIEYTVKWFFNATWITFSIYEIYLSK
jgi:hypothetical protein